MNAGWSVSNENFEDILAVSGIDIIRSEYWAIYNRNRERILNKNLEDLKVLRFNTRMKKNAKALITQNKRGAKPMKQE